VYTLVALIVTKRENFALSLKNLAAPAAAGFTIAMLQITASDVLRFFLTGTWEGFHLG
jgi:hypothetical protein